MGRAILRHAPLLALLAAAWLAAASLAPASATLRSKDGVRIHPPAGSAGTKADFNGDGFSDLAIGVWGESVGSLDDAGAVNVLYGAPSGLSATAVPDQAWDQSSTDLNGSAEEGDRFGSSAVAGDFNADGYADLAIGVPDEDIGTIPDAGAVNVVYGSPSGLSATFVADQLWDESNPFVPGEPVQADEFGGALAAGDFDGDGYVDLAIGVPGATVGTATLAGAVVVLFGSATGLTSGGSQQWTQDTAGIQDSAEPNDNFGAALASGDFHADGNVDLAIGVPNEGFGSVSEAGAVAVLYGSASGLSATFNQLWRQDSMNIQDTSESIDRFGSALAAGDFDGNGQGDLAVGVPREDVGSVTDAGAVNVFYGSNKGLSATGNQFWNQDSSGVNNMAEDGDMFGGALAAGEFGNGSQSDLAIGEETEDVTSALDAGRVNVLYGGSSGLSSAGDQFWSQDSQGINGTAEQSDFFGASLAGGDFDGDGQADLGVGAAYEQLSGMNTAGAVNVIYGSGAGLSSTDNQFWNQDSADVEGVVEAGDFFGSALASG